MNSEPLARLAETHIHFLCEEIPTRQVGSTGNQAATQYFANTMSQNGFKVERQTFDCIDMRQGEIELTANGHSFQAIISPYSLGCNIRAELIKVETVEELEGLDIKDKLLLLTGEITHEQLMPKNFVFYNPEHHQHIYQLLEEKQPAAIIAATSRNPELAGGLYPFPLFEDGDFDIPSTYLKDIEGEKLAEFTGREVHLKMDAERIPSRAENVSAQRGDQNGRILVCAHIDAKAGTPGALDNAGGTTVLMLLADLMKDYGDNQGIEILAFNGEDYYSAGGQMEYLHRHSTDLNQIHLVINLDGVGYHETPTGISFYGCPQTVQDAATQLISEFGEFEEMPQWLQGDHMVFVSQGIPAIAFTTAEFADVWIDIAHTKEDTPNKVDGVILAETAKFIFELIKRI
jgi:aminopeptidase YwaD